MKQAATLICPLVSLIWCHQWLVMRIGYEQRQALKQWENATDSLRNVPAFWAVCSTLPLTLIWGM